MKVLMSFFISNERFVNILLHEKKETLDYFDIITIEYHNSEKKHILFEDFVSEGLKSLYNALNKAINGKLYLEESLKEKGIGYAWNTMSFNMPDSSEQIFEDITLKYSLWSTTSEYGYETWIYSMDDKIYFEIGIAYKWLYREPEENEEYMEFSEFIDGYKAIDIFSIEKSDTVIWIEDINNMLKKIKY